MAASQFIRALNKVLARTIKHSNPIAVFKINGEAKLVKVDSDYFSVMLKNHRKDYIGTYNQNLSVDDLIEDLKEFFPAVQVEVANGN